LGGKLGGKRDIYHIIDQDGRLALHAAHQDHPRDLVSFLPLLVEQRKVEIEPGGDGGGTRERLGALSPLFFCFSLFFFFFSLMPLKGSRSVLGQYITSRHSPLRPAGIGRDDDCILHIHVLPDVLH
jgi:hypothetical protein